MPTLPALRPRSPAEICDVAIQLVRRHYTALLMVTAVVRVPLFIFDVTIFRAVAMRAERGPGGLLLMPSEMVAPYWAVHFFWWALMGAVVMVSASDTYVGKATSVTEAGRRVWQCVRTLLAGAAIKFAVIAVAASLASIVAAGVIAAGSTKLPRSWMIAGSAPAPLWVGVSIMCVGVCGGLYAFTHLFAMTPAIIIEGDSSMGALRRSMHLSRGLKWHILMATGLAYGIFAIASVAAGILFAMTANPMAVRIFTTITTVLAFPIVPALATVLYYDTRIRQDGYDLELLARQVMAPTLSRAAM